MNALSCACYVVKEIFNQRNVSAAKHRSTFYICSSDFSPLRFVSQRPAHPYTRTNIERAVLRFLRHKTKRTKSV
jgi:hypothetical protein